MEDQLGDIYMIWSNNHKYGVGGIFVSIYG